jgi:hypothetical protein
MRVQPLLLVGPLLLLAPAVRGDSTDPAAARAQLQQGYALKQQGKCDEAIPHFVESVRLDRQPKALINLADCEEKLGKMAASLAHFVEARDLARAQGLDPLQKLADEHVQGLEKRMPKLAVRLAKGAPSDTTIMRDGAELGPVSLNAPLPIDLGKHIIVARGGGLEHKYEVTLSEGDTKELEVTPVGGTPLPPATPSVSAGGAFLPNSSGNPGQASIDRGPSSGPKGTSIQRTIGFATIGVGAVGLVVGTIYGLKTNRKNDEIDAICPTGTICGADDQQRYHAAVDDAKGFSTISTIGFVAGGVVLGAGIVTILTAPRATTTGFRWRPVLAHDTVGAEVGATW